MSVRRESSGQDSQKKGDSFQADSTYISYLGAVSYTYDSNLRQLEQTDHRAREESEGWEKCDEWIIIEWGMELYLFKWLYMNWDTT